MPQSWDMGQILSLPLRRKACGGFFRCPKKKRFWLGLNPRTWVPEASMLTTRRLKLSMCLAISHWHPSITVYVQLYHIDILWILCMCSYITLTLSTVYVQLYQLTSCECCTCATISHWHPSITVDVQLYHIDILRLLCMRSYITLTSFDCCVCASISHWHPLITVYVQLYHIDILWLLCMRSYITLTSFDYCVCAAISDWHPSITVYVMLYHTDILRLLCMCSYITLTSFDYCACASISHWHPLITVYVQLYHIDILKLLCMWCYITLTSLNCCVCDAISHWHPSIALYVQPYHIDILWLLCMCSCITLTLFEYCICEAISHWHPLITAAISYWHPLSAVSVQLYHIDIHWVLHIVYVTQNSRCINVTLFLSTCTSITGLYFWNISMHLDRMVVCVTQAEVPYCENYRDKKLECGCKSIFCTLSQHMCA